MLITVDSQTATRLLRIYGLNPPVQDERFAVNGDAGISATIDGILDSENTRSIRLKIAGRRIARVCPVSLYEAESLINEFHAENLLPPNVKADRTLVQLITSCSKLFVEAGIDEFHLVFYLTPQGYRSHAVYMLRPRRIVAKRPAARTPEPAPLPWRRETRPARRRRRS
jgi:hypothetical protein